MSAMLASTTVNVNEGRAVCPCATSVRTAAAITDATSSVRVIRTLQKTKDKRQKTKTRDKDTRQRQGPVWCCVARLGLLSFVSRLLRILAACLREQLPH